MIRSMSDYMITIKEHDRIMEEGYQEAYEMLMAEKKKNEDLEVQLYEEYEKKLKELKEFFVEKVDQFLDMKYQECGGDITKLREQNKAVDIVEQAIVAEPSTDKEVIRKLEARIIRLTMELETQQRMFEEVLRTRPLKEVVNPIAQITPDMPIWGKAGEWVPFNTPVDDKGRPGVSVKASVHPAKENHE